MERLGYYLFVGLMAICGVALVAGGLWGFSMLFLWALGG